MRIAKSRVHFVGIGGSGMSGLAELIHNMGAKVTGSDLSENSQVERLREMGIGISIGHHADHVKDVDVVVYSTAIPSYNAEIKEAKRRHIPIIPRIEVLSEIMRLKRGIAVGGTHGKTTTTSLAAAVFLQAGLDPTVVVGGRFDLIKSHSQLGKGEWLIAESDESDGSFLKLTPEIAIITNIDNDHLDYYGSFEALQKAYLDFARLVPFYGLTVICGDDLKTRELFSEYNKRLIFYGFKPENDFRLEAVVSGYVVYKNEKKLGMFAPKVPGKHNALNALAAIIVGLEAGIPFEICVEGVQKFRGVDRRFHFRGEKNGARVYDDYGHHPTEIKATLQAFREKYPKHRLVVAFQPHRYSRTKICWEGFLSAFEEASEVWITDIYAASETPIDGVSSDKLSKAILHKQVVYVGSLKDLETKVNQELKAGDVFVTLGAGDISKLSQRLVE